MAHAVVPLFLLLLLLLTSPPSAAAAAAAARPSLSLVGGVGRRYDSIFSFGDSYTDTGNNLVAFAWYGVPNPATRPPYGSTFPGRPTGRNCDGRLIVDFLAESLGLPLVPPFLQPRGEGERRSVPFRFRGGANFAVAGATAVDAGFYHRWDPPGGGGGGVFPLNISLNVQMQWFESSFDIKPPSSLCAATPKECREFLLGRSSLFFVGELGINDYAFLLGSGESVAQVRALVPDVVRTISMAIERLIEHGAMSLVVSGTLPAGCAPSILVLFAGADAASFDASTGCLKEMNEVAVHHNALLQESLDEIRAGHPDVQLAYADFFTPVMAMVESPPKFGFEEDGVLAPCCGAPGSSVDVDDSSPVVIACGDPGSVTCEDPSARLFWDGAGHLTEAANRYIAGEWVRGLNDSPASALR